MLYRNKNTGVEIEVNSVVSGGGWELVSENAEIKPEDPMPEKTKKTAKKGKK